MLRHAGVMTGMTALSRVLGYVRDKAMAYILGTTFRADAFWLAFTIPNSFRRILGEGAMTAAFIPVFSDVMKDRSA